MLCPEIWQFKAPEHHFEIARANYRTEQIPSVLDAHYFNHSLSLVLPDTDELPEELKACVLDDSDYYKIHNLEAHILVEPEFIRAFVKKGETSLLTIGRRIDVHNLICLTPSGHLVLSLLREDYQKLGLEGEETFFDRKKHSRYVVTINLNEEAFVPGKKNYERVRRCLEKNFGEKFDVLLAWDPPAENLCPSSIAAWFHHRGYTTSLCKQTFNWRIERSISAPVPDDTCDLNDFFEWLGMFSVGCDTKNGGVDDFVNTYVCPTPETKVATIHYAQCTGFFTRSHVKKVYNAMKKFMATKNVWASFDVQGFADSPLSWHLKEHNFFIDGDNSYTIIFQTSGESIIRTSLSSNKKPRIFQ